MEWLHRDVQHRLQKMNDVSTAWMDEEIPPSKDMRLRECQKRTMLDIP